MYVKYLKNWHFSPVSGYVLEIVQDTLKHCDSVNKGT